MPQNDRHDSNTFFVEVYTPHIGDLIHEGAANRPQQLFKIKTRLFFGEKQPRSKQPLISLITIFKFLFCSSNFYHGDNPDETDQHTGHRQSVGQEI